MIDVENWRRGHICACSDGTPEEVDVATRRRLYVPIQSAFPLVQSGLHPGVRIALMEGRQRLLNRKRDKSTVSSEPKSPNLRSLVYPGGSLPLFQNVPMPWMAGRR